MPYFFCFILAAKVRHRASTLSLSVTFCHYLSLFVTLRRGFLVFFASPTSHFFRCKGTTSRKHTVGICRDVSGCVSICRDKVHISLSFMPIRAFFLFSLQRYDILQTRCPLLSASVRFCPLLSASVRFCPLLSVSVRFCPSFLGFRLLYFLYVKIIRNLCLAYGRLWSGLFLFVEVQNGSKSSNKCPKTLC